jgi:uncharacterized phage infection (PIP) family protein YhgE
LTAPHVELNIALLLLQQVQDLSGLVHSIRCYGLPAAEQQLPCDTLVTLKQELRWLAHDINSQLQQLGDQAEQLAAEVAADTKAAVAAVEGTVDSNSTSSAVAADGDGRNVTSSSSRRGLRDSSGDDSAAEAQTAGPVQERSSFVLQQQQQHPELQQLLAQHPLAPERLKQQVQDAYAGLVQQHRQQVEQLAAQQGAGSSNSSCGKHGCNCMHAACCNIQLTLRGLFRGASASMAFPGHG